MIQKILFLHLLIYQSKSLNKVNTHTEYFNVVQFVIKKLILQIITTLAIKVNYINWRNSFEWDFNFNPICQKMIFYDCYLRLIGFWNAVIFTPAYFSFLIYSLLYCWLPTNGSNNIISFFLANYMRREKQMELI